MRYLENAIVAAALSLLVLPINIVLAQTMPTPADIAEQQAKFSSLMLQTPKTVKTRERLSPNYDKGIKLPQSNPAEMAQRYARVEIPKTGTDLMVFISLSMPREVIVELSKQAKQHGAMMMLRGFAGDSMAKTEEIAKALNVGGAVWQINPDAFKVFKIKAVPAIVLAAAGASSILEEGCAKPTNFVVVNGNQSFEVALQTIRRRSANKLLVADADKRIRHIQ